VHDSACVSHVRGCRCRFRDVQNKFQRFDGNKPHFTCKFLGERYTVVYYVHQSWERCRNRGLLESLGFSFPGSGFNALVKARDQYPSTHDRIQEAMKDLILDQDQHEGTMQEPVEVIDYSSDEDFVLDGDVLD